jgi:hypothetical protein
MALLRTRLHYTVSHSSYYTILHIHILRTMSSKRPLQEECCNECRSVRPFQQRETTQWFFNESEDIPAPSFTTLVGTREQHHIAHEPTQHQYPPFQLQLSTANPPSIPNSQLQPQHLPPTTAPPSSSNPPLQLQCLPSFAAPGSNPSQLWKTTVSMACVNCKKSRRMCNKRAPCSRCEELGISCSYNRLEQDKFWLQPQCPPSAAAPPPVSSPKIQPQYLPATTDPPLVFNPQLQPQYPPSTIAPPSIPNSQLQPQDPPHPSTPNPQLQPQCLPFSSKKRASVACDRCRSTKAKCDEGHPQCSRCETDGFTCIYQAQKYVSFKELSI